MFRVRIENQVGVCSDFVDNHLKVCSSTSAVGTETLCPTEKDSLEYTGGPGGRHSHDSQQQGFVYQISCLPSMQQVDL